MKFLLPTLLLSVLFFAAPNLNGQTPTPSTEADVVKITTKIVQWDFIVVDKKGEQVTDLTEDEVEVLQDGKPQDLTGLSYIGPEGSPVTIRLNKKQQVIPPPARSRGAGRVLTFIVDDGSCNTTLSGVSSTRDGIKKFIREQMLPTDMLAIYRTRAGSSAWQQYTNDRALLLRLADKIQWRPPLGICSSLDGSDFEAAQSNTYIKRTPDGPQTRSIESEADRRIRERREDQNTSNSLVGALGVVRYVVQGLHRVPGRKVVVLFSSGLPLRDRSGLFLDAADVMRDLVDLANRASVVFNTVDARGLSVPGMIEARDEVYVEDNFNATSAITSAREEAARNLRDGLAFLAYETGGRFYTNSNDLSVPVKQVMKREAGYYLAAYEPADDTFKGKKFNKISVRIKRPGVTVYSRAGFFSRVTEMATQKKRKSDESDLYEAIAAPLPIAGLDLGLTAYFINTPSGGNAVRSFFHIEGRDIKFANDAAGTQKAVFDVVAVTLNEKNAVADEFTKSHTLRVPADAVDTIKQNGLIYSTDVPIKKPGTYTFRVAIRDSASRLIGSAGQPVDIPDLKRSDLILSGLIVSGVDADGKFLIPSGPEGDNAFAAVRTGAVPEIRRFPRGAVIAYAYTVYNAKADSTGKAKLIVQVNLFKDGKMIVEGPKQPADLQEQADRLRIKDFGFLRLGAETGDYALQVIVTDTLASGKKATSSQWIDLEVTE